MNLSYLTGVRRYHLAEAAIARTWPGNQHWKNVRKHHLREAWNADRQIVNRNRNHDDFHRYLEEVKNEFK